MYSLLSLSFFTTTIPIRPPPLVLLLVPLSAFYTESGTLFTVFGPRSMHVYNVCCNSIGLALVLDSYNITEIGGVLYSFI
jgi:hypothetical protein